MLQLLEIAIVRCVKYEFSPAGFLDIVMRSSVTAFNLLKFTWIFFGMFMRSRFKCNISCAGTLEKS